MSGIITPTSRINWANPLNRGLVGWWHGRGTPHGGTWRDLANGHHGALNGIPTWHGDHLEFDGVDDWVGPFTQDAFKPDYASWGGMVNSLGSGQDVRSFLEWDGGSAKAYRLAIKDGGS